MDGQFHSAGEQDGITRLVRWYNERMHMSLEKGETLQMAFVRKMAPAGQKVVDEQTGAEYDAR